MIRPRTGADWVFATVMSSVCDDPTTPTNFERAFVELERYPGGGRLRMRVKELARPFRQLRTQMAGGLSAVGWASYRHDALLSLKNVGLPIAVVVGDDGWALRPEKLFAAWDEHGEVHVASNSSMRWLDEHLPKHLIRDNKRRLREAVQNPAMGLHPKLVNKILGQCSTDVRESRSWPSLELYSALLALAFRINGPNQLHITFPQKWMRAAESQVAQLLRDEALLVSSCVPGEQALTCETLTGVRAGAKGGLGHRPLQWSTLHTRTTSKTLFKRASKADRNPFLIAKCLLDSR